MQVRRLGEAETDVERAVEAAIAAMPAWRDRPASYQPVAGGISNSNWRVTVDGEPHDFFLKMPGRGTEMFIDRRAANDASRKAEAAGCGPRVIAFLEQDGVEIFEFVDGLRTATNADFMRERVRLEAVAALRRFNDGPPLRLTKTLLDMIDEHLQQMRELRARAPDDMAFLKRELERARRAIHASGLDLAPCMNDTLAGNFLLRDDDSVMLVDFEYASNNDRAAELAVWFGEMFFPPEIERTLIEAYYGRYEERLEARITVFKALADVKWASWAMVQNAVSTLDFDFYKYGAWKYMRARKIMHHPDWERWLRLL